MTSSPPPSEIAPKASFLGKSALPKPSRPLVLIGLMGVGKTSIGRQLAKLLKLPFVDSDIALISQAGISIEEIFSRYGEETFRQFERKVIGQLLEDRRPKVVAVGGGAFVQPETRALIQENGISIWLRATMPQVMERIQANANRPLLKQGDPAEILAKLMEVRYPIYAEAAITVDSLDGAMYLTVQAIANALKQYLSEQPL